MTEIVLSNPERFDLAERAELDIRPDILFSWISEERLRRIGIGAIRKMLFRRPDGSVIERGMAAVRVALVGRTGLDTAVIAQEGETEFIGSHTLGSVGLKFDEAENSFIEPVWPACVTGNRQLATESGRKFLDPA